jgi:mannose-6-phosphate isomerase-like protein (cupin superfamily)
MTTVTKNYEIAQLDEIKGVDCPCGSSRRAFAHPDNSVATLHVVDISQDAKTHYHKKLTEIYYFLEGEGHMELDGELIPVRPMTSILIKPGCRHRAVGKLRVLVIPIPAFDPSDEWFD